MASGGRDGVPVRVLVCAGPGWTHCTVKSQKNEAKLIKIV